MYKYPAEHSDVGAKLFQILKLLILKFNLIMQLNSILRVMAKICLREKWADFQILKFLYFFVVVLS